MKENAGHKAQGAGRLEQAILGLVSEVLNRFSLPFSFGIICLASLLIVSLILAGCGDDAEKIRVGVSISGLSDPDFRLVKQALEENAEKYKAKIIYEPEGLTELLAKGIGVLILNCADPGSIESSVKQTHRAGVPIVILDCPPPQNLHVEAYLRINHLDAGKMAADYLVKELGGKGNVIVLEGPGDDEASRQITLGIYSVLERHELIRIVADERHPGWDRKLAADTVRSTLDKYAGNIQGVVAASSQLAVGAVQAARERRLAGRIVTVGIGADLESCRAIDVGVHDAEIDRMGYGRGLEALNLAVAVAKDEDFAYDEEMGDEDPKIKVRYSPLRLITRDNVSVMNLTWPQLKEER